MKVLAISGSLRHGSYNTGLLQAAQRTAPDGVTVEVYDGWADLPAFNQDLESAPPAAAQEFRERIADADALLVSTPEYNGSVPGALKNALDWASRPHGEAVLVGKPAAVVSASPSSFGAVWANQQMRRALMLSGAPVVETELAVGDAAEKFSDGVLTDLDTQVQVGELVDELVVLARESLAVAA